MCYSVTHFTVLGNNQYNNYATWMGGIVKMH